MKILSLRGIVSILLIFLTFSSCERYVTECATPTLSGKYVISKVKIQSVKQNTSKDTMLYTGDLCVTSMPYPFDTFFVDDLKLHMDESSIRLNCLGNIDGRDKWEITTFYTLYNCTPYYAGDLQFDYEYKEGSSFVHPRLTFFVEDDGSEHLQIKTKGVWPHLEWGENVMYTFFLTRTGP
jgi:hypothetical protein